MPFQEKMDDDIAVVAVSKENRSKRIDGDSVSKKKSLDAYVSICIQSHVWIKYNASRNSTIDMDVSSLLLFSRRLVSIDNDMCRNQCKTPGEARMYHNIP